MSNSSVRRKRLRGKYNFCVVLIILLAIVFQTGAARAESAVLECISSAYVANKTGGTTFAQFRITVAEGWKISKAALLLHTTGEPPPKTVQVGLVNAKWNEFDPSITPVAGKTEKYEVAVLKEGWIRIELNPAQARQIKHGVAVIVPDGGRTKPFHLRDSLQFSPFLLLEGTRKE